MKRFMAAAIILLVMGMVSSVWATGSCVLTSQEQFKVGDQFQRKYIKLTCTSDGSGIATYSFVPTTFGVRGWYLYNVTTDPDGTSAPSSGYGITLVAGGEDIAGGLLASRSSTATQSVAIAPSTLGYHMSDGTVAITFASITSNPGIFVMTLRFTSN